MGEKGFLRGEVTEASDGLHLKKDVNDSEDSPVMGLLTGHKTTKPGTKENEVSGNNEAPSESTIKKAIRKRASYVKANSEYVTTTPKFFSFFPFFFFFFFFLHFYHINIVIHHILI
jgi:hypothetical protein